MHDAIFFRLCRCSSERWGVFERTDACCRRGMAGFLAKRKRRGRGRGIQRAILSCREREIQRETERERERERGREREIEKNKDRDTFRASSKRALLGQ